MATSAESREQNPTAASQKLLHRPESVSPGLQLDREVLQQGIDALFTLVDTGNRYLNYFKSLSRMFVRDVGPDVDPVDLGLVTMEEAYCLFQT